MSKIDEVRADMVKAMKEIGRAYADSDVCNGI